ncbi:flagellar basal body rod protein FlgC [Rubellimicrobium sp. CFH 75288]|uniref:flagellar basal body rod protein FlgC n=1 Tax=Rubellimicrobium sp. CFH 75288 TaxID=2697034 RepID=UPI001412A714|nr:flagellar basal body rod protein FlgC [Rubellimicrobium sp. CFH 75288]NAZ37295.1 flagellar basal body rod protein FlgC [Rubellimicrobium sp. CFH 75288]
MADLTDALGAAMSGMRAQALRLRLSAENAAHADTPGFHRKTVSFREVADGLVGTGPVRLDPTPPERRHDPSHPLADAEGYVEGSNVNLLLEIADAREAGRSYEANLKMFEQTRAMSSALLDLLRR